MKIVLTGCDGQLGRAIAAMLSSAGHEVIGVDIRDRSENVSIHSYHRLDITKISDVSEFFEFIGDIDCLINNAGIGVFTPTLDRTVEEFRSVMEVNLLGTFLMCQQYIKHRLRDGKIVNIASMYGHISSDYRIYGESGRNNSEVYSATKAGVLSLTKYLSVNFAHKGFMINSVSPGGVFNAQTNDFLENYKAKSPQDRLAKSDEIANVVNFLATIAPNHLNGEDIIVDGGFTKW